MLGSHNSLHSHLTAQQPQQQNALGGSGGSQQSLPLRTASVADIDMQGADNGVDGVVAPISLQVRRGA